MRRGAIIKKFLFILMIILLVTTGCSKQTSNTQNSNNNNTVDNLKKSDAITEISIDYDSIVALNENGELYVIGQTGMASLGLGDGIEYASKPTKVAEGVKEFLNEGAAIYYINNNNDLYYTGMRLEGGVEKSFVLLKENIQKVISFNGFCVITTDFDNNSYGVVGKLADNVCGLSFAKYSEFTKITSNVKHVFAVTAYNGYVNNKNELFISKLGESGYEKTMDDVKKIVVSGYNLYILTEDNSLYYLDFRDSAKKIFDNVVDISNDGLYFVTQDGKLHFRTSYKNDLIILDETEGYGRLKFDNIEKILYVSNGKYVFLSKDNKIEMHTEYDKHIVENNISSIEQILKFVSN